MNTLCPCGSGKPLISCCEPFILGKAVPITPEQLMRSRYTAYSQGAIEYIMATMRGVAAKNFNEASARQWANSVIWQKLEVIQISPIKSNTGFVEFKAYYSVGDEVNIIHENSKFKQIAGRWYYISGHNHA